MSFRNEKTGTRPASQRVLRAVAEETGKEPTELDVLQKCVDPDSLNALCAQSERRPDRSDVEITFDYAGYEVTVDTDGSVSVDDPPTDPSRSPGNGQQSPAANDPSSVNESPSAGESPSASESSVDD